MAEVDRGDQLRGYYHRHTKSRKFYKYVPSRKHKNSINTHCSAYRYLFNLVVLTNSFIMFRLRNPSSTIRSFQETLGNQLIGTYCSRKTAGRVSHPIRPLALQHYPRQRCRPSIGRKRGKLPMQEEGSSSRHPVVQPGMQCVALP